MKSPIERRIRQKLHEKGMSVTELAKELDVSRVALYYLFKGNFSREMLSRISRVLAIPAHVLISPDDEVANSRDSKLGELYKMASKETQKAVDLLLKVNASIKNRRPVVVVLDDLEDNAALLKRVLRKDYEVIDFTDPFLALKAMETRQVDAVVTDQRMPKMTGTDFLKKIDELGKNVARLIVSAYTDNQAFIQAINETKVDAFLLKPVSPTELKERLEKVLTEQFGRHVN